MFRSHILMMFLGAEGFMAYADVPPEEKASHHQILIVGGGSAGIAVAAQLRRSKKLIQTTNPKGVDIAIVEPNDKHYYQPGWTLVGGGVFKKEDTVKDTAKVIPRDTTWIKSSVQEFIPENNTVVTNSGEKISYDYMVVATGVELYLDKIKGLKESLGKNGVSTNYSFDYIDKTWEFLKEFKGGNAIFTVPDTPIKCGGAPLKAMWLADDYMRKNNIRSKANFTFASAITTLFPVKRYADSLEVLVKERDINVKFKHLLVEVRGEAKEAVFKRLEDGTEVTMKYDFLHVTPPMGTSDSIKNSSLAAPNGFVDVNKFTLQHTKFNNVFSLGDCANLPTSKTIAALTQQVPTLVTNLIYVMNNKTPIAKYDGYTSCPIITSYNRLIMAEFLYDGVPHELFSRFFDQTKPNRLMYFVKETLFPKIYWHLYLPGIWYGPHLFWNPKSYVPSP